MALDTTTILIAALVVMMIVVAYLEMKYLRKSARERRMKAAKETTDVPDEAHNALVTTKAIAAALEADGIRSDEVSSLLKEAQMAYNRRNFRVAIELTQRTKSMLMDLKKKQASQGDLAKLGSLPTSGSNEVTTKERLQKEFPPNLTQARFALGVAESSIAEGRNAARDVSQAEGFLSDAKSRFDAEDYSTALHLARLAQRSAAGEKVEAEVPAPVAKPTTAASAAVPAPPSSTAACASCGAALKPDDAFCRECGTPVGPKRCPACGAPLVGDDVFCRKCGTRIAS